MAIRNALSILLLAGGLASALHAQPRSAYRFEHIQVPGGGNENFVTSITQDSLGFIWFGTWGGLHRYDGYAFTTFAHDPADSTSLSANWVECLYVDREGTLWVGTYGGGLNRFDSKTEAFTRYRHDADDPTSLSRDSVTVVLGDHRGPLWVGTQGGGLNRFDRETGTFTRYRYDPDDPTSLSNDQVRALYEDRQGTLWVGTNSPFPGERYNPGPGGLNRFNRDTGTFTRYLHDPTDSTSLISNHVMSLFEDSRGTFWVGTSENGLHAMNRETGTFTRYRYDVTRPDTLSSPRPQPGASALGSVSIIFEDDAGFLWTGGYGGELNRYDPASGDRVHFEQDPTDPASLSSNNVWHMYQSNDGTRWVSMVPGGIDKVRTAHGPFEHYSLTPLHSNNAMNALHVDASGAIHVGSCCPESRVISFGRTGDNASPYQALSTRSHPEVTIATIAHTRDGTLWVGTYEGTPTARRGGLYQMDRETGMITPIITDSARSGARMGPVVAVHEDDEDTLWLGTRWSGLFRLDRATGALTHYAYQQGDSTNRNHASVTTLHRSSSTPDVLWVGTEGSGLYRFDRQLETFTRYRPLPGDPTSLGGGYVTSMYEDARGRLWVGTRRGGLNRFDRTSETFVRFTAYNSGLPDNNISCLLGDDSGQLWMGTGRGLTRFNSETELFYTYGPEHGVRAAPFVTGACGDHADTLVFGGTNGFVAFDPDAVRTEVSAPPVVLTGLYLAGQPVGPSSEGPLYTPLHEAEAIRLTHDEHTFSFGFAALDYRDPEANQYAYLLEGYDDRWREAGRQRQARYHRVPPGEYVFRVRAANSDGVWNENGASVRVTVLPPWWHTTWAYVLYGLVLAGGIFAVDRIQRRRLIERERKRATIREAEIRAETAEVQAYVAEEHAQKLEELDEAKSRFFANVSHEFRTPLTLLLGPIQDVLAGTTDGLSRLQLVAMHRNAHRLLELINQLLDLARVETGSMQLHRHPVDVVALLRGITIAFSAQADRERIALSFHSEADRVPAFIDPDKIEKVIFNLLSNAFKFTPSGQKVRIHLQIVDSPSGTQAEIVVKDTGQGIPPEKLAHIFDRFFQVGDAANREQASTGIGLALAKEFVELHDGQIEAESEPGFGTTFTVRVPLEQDRLAPEEALHAPRAESFEVASDIEGSGPIDEPDAGAPESVRDTEAASPSDACVLIVEDNADVRSYVQRLLTPHYRVVEARDGDEGFNAVQQHQPDLVIADVMMPRRSGFDLCRDLKADEALSHLPVVLLTAKADRASRRDGLEAGADAYLAKPFDAEELLLRVENLIALRRQLRTRYSDTVVVQPTEVEVSSRDAAFLERVRAVVEEHLDDPTFGVERLAAAMNLSTRQLQRRLRTTTDLSAAAFIRKMRLERAAQLLEQDAGLVSQIAYRVGYQNADAFSRVFRQVFGVPPSEYPD